MKKPRRSLLAISTICGSVLVIAGIAIYSDVALKRLPLDPLLIRQEAGQTVLADPSIKGGFLQKGLKNTEKAQEYIVVETGMGAPRYATRSLTVHAGKLVRVTLRNNSKVGQSDNWVLVKPGTREQVESAARQTPQGREWIPESSAVLAFVPVTKPGHSSARLFRAPNQPGDYPYLCTYAGRGESMNGVLHVID